jgi:hypothetical protein
MPSRLMNLTTTIAGDTSATPTAVQNTIQPSSFHEITFNHPSAAGPPLVLRSAPKNTTTRFTEKARAASTSSTDTIANIVHPSSSSNGNISNKNTAENSSPGKKPFGNVGGKIIKAAPGLSQAKTAARENKEPGMSKGKGKGKEKVTEIPEDNESDGAAEPTVTAGPSTVRKISYAQIIGS